MSQIPAPVEPVLPADPRPAAVAAAAPEDATAAYRAVLLPPRAQVLEAPTRPPIMRYVFAGLLVIGVFFGGFGAWAALAPLASAALAHGRVVVESSRKTVQHLEGGIIEEIRVRAGDQVLAGDLLVTLAPVQAGAKVDALRRELANLHAAQARLQAHLKGAAAPEFPPELLEQTSDPVVGGILRAQQELFTTAKISLDGQISVLEQRAGQLEAQIRGLREQITSSDRQLALLGQQRKDIGFLVEQQLARKSQLFELERQIASVGGQRGNDRQRVEEARKAIGEVQTQVISLRDEFIDKQAQELDKVRSQLAEMTQSLRAAEDVFQRLEVRAPVAGTVVNLKYFTRGGVVGPGQPILDIVPADDRLVVEVRISPLDIDSVRPGLPAELRLTAFKTRSTPLVPGELAVVSADLLEDERTGQPYYVGQINVEPGALARLRDVKLYPGMPVDALIRLEDRTFVDYILAPLEQSFERAFRES